MKNKHKYLGLVVLIILIAVLFFMRGNEDTWICENGEWVKHGNPDKEQPTTICPKSNSDSSLPLTQNNVACYKDAKECPDGSIVGRTGPNCEFICPEVKNIKNDLINNICKKDDDCKYIWSTGGCHTPEYVDREMKKCQDKTGPCPSEAQPRENVTCTCENSKCVTQD